MIDEHKFEAFNNDDILSVTPVSGGLFNTLACIHTTKGLFYYKQFKDGQSNAVFNPPDIPAEQRFLLASIVQNIAYEETLSLGKVIPKIVCLCSSKNAMIMESAEGGKLLIDQLSTGQLPETSICILPRILGLLHNNTYGKFGTNTIHDNSEFRNFKLSLQYDGLKEYVTPDELRIISETKRAYQRRKVCITHGDPNSRNIYSAHNAIGLFDFEQSHLGSPAYDLAYILCEMIIADKYFGKLIRNKSSTQSWLHSFLNNYFETFSKEPADEIKKELTTHLGIQMLYRIYGPSRASWTFYIPQEQKDPIIEYAKYILKNEQKSVDEVVYNFPSYQDRKN